MGWAATFALLAAFVCLAGLGPGRRRLGAADLVRRAVRGCSAICVHFLTSLPDLVRDNASRVRHLPLRVALHIGATKLLVISGVATVAVLAALVVADPLGRRRSAQ